MPVCFLMWDRKWVDLNGREGKKKQGGVRGEQNIIRIYCRENLFSVKYYFKNSSEKWVPWNINQGTTEFILSCACALIQTDKHVLNKNSSINHATKLVMRLLVLVEQANISNIFVIYIPSFSHIFYHFGLPRFNFCHSLLHGINRRKTPLYDIRYTPPHKPIVTFTVNSQLKRL